MVSNVKITFYFLFNNRVSIIFNEKNPFESSGCYLNKAVKSRASIFLLKSIVMTALVSIQLKVDYLLEATYKWDSIDDARTG